MRKKNLHECPTCEKNPCACPGAAAGSDTPREEKNENGKIVFLCGTSTAGKTSICVELKKEGNVSGREWIVDGSDSAEDAVWKLPSQIDGQSYPSAEQHFIAAMKEHIDSAVVDEAVAVSGARTLAVAVLSRQNLGNPKVDKVNLTPCDDIPRQAMEVHASKNLSLENKAKYQPRDIVNILRIIQACPAPEMFPQYLPLNKVKELMLDRAIANARAGKSTILDVIGTENIAGKNMVEVCREKLKGAGLPEDTAIVVVAHCPVNRLIDRIETRNASAKSEEREEDIRLAFFPFEQYGALYEKASEESDDVRPVVGYVTKEDLYEAAGNFGASKWEALPVIETLGFGDEERIAVVPKLSCDMTFQTGDKTAKEIAQELCAKVFDKNATEEFAVEIERAPTLGM